MAQQWEAEAELRRLNDPHPLPVSWEPAAADLVEESPASHDGDRLAGEARPRGRALGHRPDDLRRSGNDLVDILTVSCPPVTLVLGEPGAGKTIPLVRLVLDLLPPVRLATRSRRSCHWRLDPNGEGLTPGWRAH